MKNTKKVSIITNKVIDNNSVSKKIENQISRVHRFLTDDLLKKDWKEVRTTRSHFTKGFGYVVSEYLYYKNGFDTNPNVVPMVSRDEKTGQTHWFLFNKKTKTIIDGTSEQWNKSDLRKLYKSSRGCGFLTNVPSKRTQKLMEKMK